MEPNQAQKRMFIQRIQDLPTLPTTLIKIIEIIDSPTAKASDLGDILSKDPSLSSLILKLVNSAFYGNFRQVTSITHASVLLGFQMVKTIAMGVSIFESAIPGNGPTFDRKAFWIHSISVATMANRLCNLLRERGWRDLDGLFLAGLLHDVGKVIFDNFFNEEYREVIALVKQENLWIRDAEERVLGFDHTLAGFYLGSKWQFPEMVVAAIRYHHNLEECPPEHQAVASVIHMADAMCRSLKLGSGGDDATVSINPIAYELTGLDEDTLELEGEELINERAAIEAFVYER